MTELFGVGVLSTMLLVNIDSEHYSVCCIVNLSVCGLVKLKDCTHISMR